MQHRLAGLGAFDARAVLQDSGDRAFGFLGVVAEEFRVAQFFAQREPQRIGRGFARTGPGAARIFALLRHGGVEAVRVDFDAARAQRILRQVERKAERVVELERDVARELVARAEIAGGFLEQLQSARQRFAEARSLRA